MTVDKLTTAKGTEYKQSIYYAVINAFEQPSAPRVMSTTDIANRTHYRRYDVKKALNELMEYDAVERTKVGRTWAWWLFPDVDQSYIRMSAEALTEIALNE